MTSYGSESLADHIIILRGAVTASTIHDRGLSVSSAIRPLGLLPRAQCRYDRSRPPDALFASEISLCGLNRNVTEQELDLFQLSSGKTA